MAVIVFKSIEDFKQRVQEIDGPIRLIDKRSRQTALVTLGTEYEDQVTVTILDVQKNIVNVAQYDWLPGRWFVMNERGKVILHKPGKSMYMDNAINDNRWPPRRVLFRNGYNLKRLLNKEHIFDFERDGDEFKFTRSRLYNRAGIITETKEVPNPEVSGTTKMVSIPKRMNKDVTLDDFEYLLVIPGISIDGTLTWKMFDKCEAGQRPREVILMNMQQDIPKDEEDELLDETPDEELDAQINGNVAEPVEEVQEEE